MKHLNIMFLVLLSLFISPKILAQEIYQTNQVITTFFSTTPIEDIKAVSNSGASILNTETGEILFQIRTRSFQFRKALMQEHFNENYLESEKHPFSSFKGRILDKINFGKDGEYQVKCSGNLIIHGVGRKREILLTIQVKNGQISIKSQFDVACKDHDIKIPKILWENIAEVISVEVNVNYQKLTNE
ncbi:YceI family protein [Salegentibacter sp. JZCK2]|uniref:YceI family protein n=1 Tax=Salegentibacter tibetensis TaxID=2873600 RepID=UPI001CCC07E9|nr:YceI family protein [Salegentibacter tibetensis]MBZ9731546.1 YceI family protein [Salegentibacter tibetensis]